MRLSTLASRHPLRLFHTRLTLPTSGAGHHLIDFWTNMCLNHNLITEGELDTEDFRSGRRHRPQLNC